MPGWSRRTTHFFASSRYAGCGVITRNAFNRSIGMIRRIPASGPALRSPIALSISARDRLDVGVLQREQADRHAGHPVDVERVDRLEQVLQLALGAREDQHVAQIVGAHGRRVLHERLEDAHHFADADVAQRHDLHRKAGRQRALRIAELRRDVAADGGRARQDLVEAVLLDHRRAVHPQQRLERGDQRVARDARRRADRDLAADRRVDRVALVQDVAEDVPDDLAQVGALEIEDDAAAALLHHDRARTEVRRLAAGP